MNRHLQHYNLWEACNIYPEKVFLSILSFQLDFHADSDNRIWRVRGMNRVCALDWVFYVCCTCRDGCRAGEQSISSLLEVAGAIMGNGQEKTKTFNTKVVLLPCYLQIAGATLRVGCTIGWCRCLLKPLQMLIERLNA